MDGLKERESTAEALYIHRIEAEFNERLKRIRRLGSWASNLMTLKAPDEERYQDILYRLALAGGDDLVIVDRVRDDLSAASISVSRERVCEVLGHGEARP